MKYAGIIRNDLAAAPGVCVSFFTQGCPHHCEGCHNPETWDFNGGKEFTPNTLVELEKALTANGVHRDLCIMGGEPLCKDNLFLTLLVIKEIKNRLPDTKIYIWTGYLYEKLLEDTDVHLKQILELTDYIIDGPFILSQRDTTLKMRGSANQKIYYLKK